MIQAGLIKAFDFSTTAGFMESGGWSMPTFAALMVTVAETAGGIGLILGVLTPLAACAVVGAMICAWAVNVSQGAFWSEPFNVPFLLFIGATTLLFTGAGAYSWTPGCSAGCVGPGDRGGTARAGVRRGDPHLDPVERDKPDPFQFTGVIPGQLLASSLGPYPAVRIATIFRIVTQRFLNGDAYCSVHVDRRHQC